MPKKRTRKLTKIMHRSNGDGRVLATLSEEDRREYVRLMALLEAQYKAFVQADAAATAFARELVVRYELPTRFEINFQTGTIYPAKPKENVDAEAPV